MNKRKVILCAVILTGILFALAGIWLSNYFAPGSYPYAERYELNYSEERVNEVINDFKKENQQYTTPVVKINDKRPYQLADGLTNGPRGYFCFYFYYREENEIILTLTTKIDRSKTELLFVSVNKGVNIGNWKKINRDLENEENEEQKRKFEQRILNKIKEKL